MSQRNDISTMIFGAFDGMISVLGVVIILLHRNPHQIVGPVLGLAVASTISMGAGEWLGGSSLRTALLMCGATLAGTVVPALPLFFSTALWTRIVWVAIMIIVGLWISAERSKKSGWPKASLQTYGTLITASVVCAVVAIMLPGSGG